MSGFPSAASARSFMIRIEQIRDYVQIVNIHSLFKRILPEQYSHFMLAEMFVRSREYIFMAFYEAEIIGSVVGKTENTNGYIAMLGVDECYRNRGVGKSLVWCCVEKMREKGLMSVYLEAETSNYAAISLYEKLGFKKTMFLDRYYVDLSPAYKLEMMLSGTDEDQDSVHQNEKNR